MWGLRPTATRISSASTAPPSFDLDDRPRRRRRAPTRPRRRAARRRRSGRAAPPPLLRRRTAPRVRAGGRPASTSVTFVPSEAQAWESSEPTGPPPSTIMLAGTSFGGGRLAVVPGADRVEAVDRRHRRARAGGDDHRPRGDQLVVADRDPALADEPTLAAEEVDLPFFEPGQLARVVLVVDRRVAAGEDRRRVELGVRVDRHAGDPLRLGEHVGRPQQRLRGHAGVVGAFAADQVFLDDRHLPARVGEPPAHDLAGRAGAEDDRVVGLLGHRVAPYPACPDYAARTLSDASSTGATGFDVVDSCERLQVEVAGGLVKPRHQPIRADHEFALAA